MLLLNFTYFYIDFILYCCCYVAVEEPSLRIVLVCTIRCDKSHSDSDSAEQEIKASRGLSRQLQEHLHRPPGGPGSGLPQQRPEPSHVLSGK